MKKETKRQREIRLLRNIDLRQRVVAGPRETGDAGTREAHEVSAAVSRHCSSPFGCVSFVTKRKSCAPERARQARIGAPNLCASQ